MNATVYKRVPGAITIAEESTSWPGVTRPTHLGGLGFGFKWNMGWMHDSLGYVAERPDPPAVPPRPADLLAGLRLLRELRAADQPRRGRARQGLAAAQDARRPVAAAREPAHLPRLHVGAPRQAAAVHGHRSSARRPSGPSSRELDWWLLDNADHRGRALAGARPEPASTRTPPRCGRWTPTARASPWIDAERLQQQRVQLHPVRRRTRPTVRWCASRTSPPYPTTTTGSGCPAPARGPRCSTPTPRSYAGSGVGNLGAVTADQGEHHGQPASAIVTRAAARHALAAAQLTFSDGSAVIPHRRGHAVVPSQPPEGLGAAGDRGGGRPGRLRPRDGRADPARGALHPGRGLRRSVVRRRRAVDPARAGAARGGRAWRHGRPARARALGGRLRPADAARRTTRGGGGRSPRGAHPARRGGRAASRGRALLPLPRGPRPLTGRSHGDRSRCRGTPVRRCRCASRRAPTTWPAGSRRTGGWPRTTPTWSLHLGDYIYEYGAPARYASPRPRADATLADYRLRHAQYRTDPDLQAAHAVAPWVVVWDDHDVENNYAGLTSRGPPEPRRSRRAGRPRTGPTTSTCRCGARAADGPRLHLYRRIRWGRLATFHMLDTRQYRDDQACGDGV